MKKNRKIKSWTLLLAGICVALTGCSVPSAEQARNLLEDKLGIQTEAENEEKGSINSSKTQVETKNDISAKKVQDAAYLVADLGGKYAYSQLDETEQIIYQEILEILLKGLSEVTISTLDIEQLGLVFDCVMADHPELFYVTGYSYTTYSVNDELSSLDFSGTYTMSIEEISQKSQLLEPQIETLLQNMPAVSSDYEIAKYLYEEIIFETNYNLNAVDNQNICSVFLNHESVCQGYAKAMQYLLLQKGIESVLVTGTVTSGEGHAWVIAQLDGDFYHIDPTWGDASYNAVGVEEVSNLPEINYDYLCVTTQDIMHSHQIDEFIPFPICTSQADNYYVREGLYFTGVEEGLLQEAFEAAYALGKEFLTIKCGNPTVFDEMCEYLLGDEKPHIFEYLSNDVRQVVYTTNQEQCTFSVWLE